MQIRGPRWGLAGRGIRSFLSVGFGIGSKIVAGFRIKISAGFGIGHKIIAGYGIQISRIRKMVNLYLLAREIQITELNPQNERDSSA